MRNKNNQKSQQGLLYPLTNRASKNMRNQGRRFCSVLQERKKDALDATLNWLNTHELVYDEVHQRAC
jgi:hypothetical protein